MITNAQALNKNPGNGIRGEGIMHLPAGNKLPTPLGF